MESPFAHWEMPRAIRSGEATHCVPAPPSSSSPSPSPSSRATPRYSRIVQIPRSIPGIERSSLRRIRLTGFPASSLPENCHVPPYRYPLCAGRGSPLRSGYSSLGFALSHILFQVQLSGFRTVTSVLVPAHPFRPCATGAKA